MTDTIQCDLHNWQLIADNICYCGGTALHRLKFVLQNSTVLSNNTLQTPRGIGVRNAPTHFMAGLRVWNIAARKWDWKSLPDNLIEI